MARQETVILVCDMTGEPAEDTVEFSLDGVTCVVDLTAGHALRLREFLREYLAAGRKTTAAATRSAVRKANAEQVKANRARNQAIKDWARSSGLTVSNRGRLPAEVVKAHAQWEQEQAEAQQPAQAHEHQQPEHHHTAEQEHHHTAEQLERPALAPAFVGAPA